jgi:CHASE2 domain-containing sensor protein
VNDRPPTPPLPPEGLGPEDPTRDRPAGVDEPTLPAALGPYRLTEAIARHGQGRLFRATDPRLSRPVAIKVVTAEEPDSHRLERCEAEARVLAQIDHPNVVKVYDVGPPCEFAGRPARYFVMPLLESPRSLTRQADEERLRTHQRVELAAGLCEGLDAAHRRGVFHRDLKPDNLIVDKAGVARVIDFGLACGLPSDPEEHLRRIERGHILGTPEYMAPEQFEGDPDLIDQRTDVYAMGVVLYELLVGVLPYAVRGKPLAEIASAVRHAPPDPPRTLRRDLDPALEGILLRALAKRPADRHQSMQLLARDLRRWADHNRPAPLRASGAEGFGSTLRRWALTRPRRTLAGATLASLLLALVVVRGLVNDLLPLDPWLHRVGMDLRAAGAPPFENVRGVAVSGEDARAIAQAAGIPGVDPADTFTFRPVHAWLLDRLAEARPRVVAIDINFSDRDDPGDTALAAAVETLRNRGCAVVFGGWDWPDHANAPHGLHPEILGDNPWGPPTGEFLASGWRVDLAIQQPGDTSAIPGFALAALAARLQPDKPFTVSLEPARNVVVMEFLEASGFGWSRAPAREEIAATQIRPDTGGAANVKRGALVATLALEVPPNPAFEEATVSAAALIDARPADLHRAFDGRIVVIGQAVAQAPDAAGSDPIGTHSDRTPRPGGGSVNGFQVQMLAIEALARGRLLRSFTLAQDGAAVFAACLAGLAIGVRGPAGRLPRRFLVLSLAAGVLAFTPLAVLSGPVLLRPLPMVSGLVLSYIATRWVIRARGDRGEIAHNPGDTRGGTTP